MKKGFTLIELLAVIVILAIVAVITIPLILGVIEKSKKGAFRDSALNVFGSAEYYLLENNISGDTEINIKDVKMKNNNFKSGKVIVKDRKYLLENVSNGEYCANGSINDLVINKGACDITVPQIDISFENNTAIIKFTDDINLGGYYITTTSEETPSYTKISGKEFILNYTITETTRYYIYVKDSVGNINSKYFDLCPKDTIWDYTYKTEAQEFIVPANGKYKLEAWGAGTSGTISGSYYASDGRWTNLSFGIGNPYSNYGAYATGNVYLKAGTKIYVYVGGSKDSSGWNGTNHGGSPITVTIVWEGQTISQTTDNSGTYSSGATDFRILKSDALDGWSGDNSLTSRIVTAGGAGATGMNGHCRADWNAGNRTYTKYGYTRISSSTPNKNNILGKGSVGSGTTASIYKNDGGYLEKSWYDYGAGGAGYYGGTADTAGTSLVQNYTDSLNNVTYTLIDSSISNGMNNTNGKAKITLVELSN